jgi:formate transporter
MEVIATPVPLVQKKPLLLHKKGSAMPKVPNFDALLPGQVVERLENIGAEKTKLPPVSLLLLGMMAGAFIGFGALFYTLITSDTSMGFAGGRLLGGVAFCLGLILVVASGAELFTGNNLLTIAWAGGKISTLAMVRNWVIVCLANFVGAASLALIVVLSGHTEMNNGLIAEQYMKIAAMKSTLPFWTAFFRGLLCNALVCMAIWMALSGRSLIDKVVVIVFPISAFVAAGFEHSVANMYFLSIAMILQVQHGITAADAIGWADFLGNMVPVILGNLVGGSVVVGLVFHVIHPRKPMDTKSTVLGDLVREVK